MGKYDSILEASQGPVIIGWRVEDGEDERADTTLRRRRRVEYGPAVEGDVSVALYASVDDEDRGGVVITLKGESCGSSWAPYAVMQEDGTIELHLCGDEEARAAQDALLEVLRKAQPIERDAFWQTTFHLFLEKELASLELSNTGSEEVLEAIVEAAVVQTDIVHRNLRG